ADSVALNAGITAPPFSTWRWTIANDGFSWSRFGPTVPVEPAFLSVWQLTQPAEVNTALPAVASPWAPPGVVAVGVEVVGAGAAVVVVSPAALSFSLPKMITAESIATTKRAQSSTYQPMPRPGKFAFRRDSRRAETSANTMNAPPTTARPV